MVESLEARYLLSTLTGQEAVGGACEGETSLVNCEPVTAVTQSAVVAPVAEDDWVSVPPGESVCVPVLVNDYDSDGWLVAATVEVTEEPETGQVEVNDLSGEICYTVGAGFDGVDQFRYAVEDNEGNRSNEAIVTVVCWQNPRNRLDVNGDGCLAPIDMLCVVNRLVANPGDCSLPAAGCTPPAFCDVNGDNHISPVDALCVANALNMPAPTAVEDWAVTLPGEPVEIDLLANDCVSGGELDPSSVTLVNAATTGTVSLDEATGVALYTPGDDFSGTDQFAYVVQDCSGRMTRPTAVTIVSWQNPEDRHNVDARDGVTGGDALCLINWLRANPGDPSLPEVPMVPPPFYDVTGDFMITPKDLVSVLTALDSASLSWDVLGIRSVDHAGTVDEFLAALGQEDVVWEEWLADMDNPV
jgi:hypothetical protein